jgi:hypothetical protein
MLHSCGGDAFTVGVLWDYVSLPQPVRTTWYAHPYTHCCS